MAKSPIWGPDMPEFPGALPPSEAQIRPRFRIRFLLSRSSGPSGALISISQFSLTFLQATHAKRHTSTIDYNPCSALLCCLESPVAHHFSLSIQLPENFRCRTGCRGLCPRTPAPAEGFHSCSTCHLTHTYTMQLQPAIRLTFDSPSNHTRSSLRNTQCHQQPVFGISFCWVWLFRCLWYGFGMVLV